jgi:hypothetical protein
MFITSLKADQIADLLTKALSIEKTRYLRRQFGIASKASFYTLFKSRNMRGNWSFFLEFLKLRAFFWFFSQEEDE